MHDYANKMIFQLKYKILPGSKLSVSLLLIHLESFSLLTS